jgi:hypothetical protein
MPARAISAKTKANAHGHLPAPKGASPGRGGYLPWPHKAPSETRTVTGTHWNRC